MEKGGNDSYARFLRQYGLELADIRTKVTCKASTYYRGLLDGKEVGQQPPLEDGRLIDKQTIPLADMNSEEMLETAKEKALWFGNKTKELGQQGVKTVQEKWASGQIQEGAKKAATTVSTNAKWLWGKISSTVAELASGENNNARGSGNGSQPGSSQPNANRM